VLCFQFALEEDTRQDTRPGLTGKENVENDAHGPQVHRQAVPARVPAVPDDLRRDVPAVMKGISEPEIFHFKSSTLPKLATCQWVKPSRPQHWLC
jgi:hypothetical protein